MDNLNEKVEYLGDKLDVTNYVGYYVKSYKLNKKIKYDNTCEFTNYDLVYEIKKDNTINRYMVNECVGTVLIYSDKLGYVKNEKTRNIGTKSYIYVFNNNKLTQPATKALTTVKSESHTHKSRTFLNNANKRPN